MKSLAQRLAQMGYSLRSGGAVGADRAFESGAGDRKWVFLSNSATEESMAIAKKFHPAWDRCSKFARLLHGRNSFQVLGSHLDTPSKFMVCWTPGGEISHKERSIKTGGTGTAISIADHYGVKIFNLARPDHLERINAFLREEV
jgi:hypothetical protein